MNIVIDWFAFLTVFVAALTGAIIVVTFYAVGLRLLVRSGRAPLVRPATFTDAITVISAKDARRVAKQAAKAARKSPLTDGQKKFALVGAYACFGLCAVAIAAGIVVIIVGH